MAVSKDSEKGTWTSQIWIEDWQGKKKHKKKRGFATKKEALEWEHSMQLASKTDMNMKMADFVDIYFRDKEGELKQRTVRNKKYMIEHHIIPTLGISHWIILHQLILSSGKTVFEVLVLRKHTIGCCRIN